MIYYDFTGMAKKEYLDIDYYNLDYVMRIFKQGGYHSQGYSLMREGCLKNMGWYYDFKDDLKHYLVKEYGTWNEYYAPNKTLLRKNIHNRIERIVEI